VDAQVEQLWQMANILGAVVVVVVAALLTILVLLVHRIRRRVAAIKATLVATQANTADTVLITTTAGGVEAVLAEGLEHHLFLGRVLDKVRS
jgi:H+/gluconate symporter-like permease